MCGNGIRCLVRFAFDEGILVPGETTVNVETASGLRQVTPIWENGVMSRARVSMGEPGLRAGEIPATAPGHESITDYRLNVDGYAFDVSCVSMGNPHAVAFTDVDVDSLRLAEAGPLVEHHPMFPERVNFEIVNLIDSVTCEGSCLGAWIGANRGVRHRSLRGGGLGPSARLCRRRRNGEPSRWRPVYLLARQGRGHPGGPRRAGLRRRLARLALSKSPIGPPRTKFSVLVSFCRYLQAPSSCVLPSWSHGDERRDRPLEAIDDQNGCAHDWVVTQSLPVTGDKAPRACLDMAQGAPALLRSLDPDGAVGASLLDHRISAAFLSQRC